MAFMDFLFGKGSKTKTKPIYNPQQEDLLNMILGNVQQQLPQGMSNLQNILGGDEGTFEAFGRPARRGFEQKTLPTIAERFTSGLGEGGFRSSAFGQAIGQAGKELEEDMFSTRIGMQGDALSQLLQLIQPATASRQFESISPRKTGFLENLVSAIASGAASGMTGGKK